MIIAVGTDKAFDKTQHPFMITLSKLKIQGTYHNTIKATYDKPAANITVNRAKLSVIPCDREQRRDIQHRHSYSA